MHVINVPHEDTSSDEISFQHMREKDREVMRRGREKMSPHTRMHMRARIRAKGEDGWVFLSACERVRREKEKGRD